MNFPSIIKYILIIGVTILLVVVLSKKLLMSQSSEFDVYKEYFSIASNEISSPLDVLDLNKQSIKIILDGKVHISIDQHNTRTNLFDPKYKYQFVGEITFGDYKLKYDDKNPLVSTELILLDKLSIYASTIVNTSTIINDNIYFLGVTVVNDSEYNLNEIELNVYDSKRSLIVNYTFNL